MLFLQHPFLLLSLRTGIMLGTQAFIYRPNAELEPTMALSLFQRKCICR